MRAGFSGAAGGTPWGAGATGAPWPTAGPALASALAPMAPGRVWWLEFRDVARTSLAVSWKGDTSSPQGTAPATSPGTGTCYQRPSLSHSLPSCLAADPFPSDPGSSTAGVSQGPGAVLRPPPEEPGMGGVQAGVRAGAEPGSMPGSPGTGCSLPLHPACRAPLFLGCFLFWGLWCWGSASLGGASGSRLWGFVPRAVAVGVQPRDLGCLGRAARLVLAWGAGG